MSEKRQVWEERWEQRQGEDLHWYLNETPKELVALSTGVLQFASTNQEDYEKLQRIYAPYQRVPFRKIAELPRGSAYVAFQRSPDPGRLLCLRAFARPAGMAA